MEEYNNALRVYISVLNMKFNCSHRAQEIIDSAYLDMSNAYNKLTPRDKINNTLPTKVIYKVCCNH